MDKHRGAARWIMNENMIQILDDQPIENAKLFNFKSYTEALGGIITRKETNTPLVIGIFGDWGSGKTSLMRTLDEKIKIDEVGYPAKTIWFNAWKYDKEEAIWRALLMRILEELKTGFLWDEITDKEKDRFLEFLRRDLNINLSEKATIEKKDDKTIRISDGDQQLFLRLNEDEAEAVLENSKNKVEHFILKREIGKIRLYEKNLHCELNDLQKSLYGEIYREEPGALSLDLGKAAKGVLQLGIEMVPYIKEIKGWIDKGDKNGLTALAEAVQREKIITSIDKVQFMEQFQERFQNIIDKYYLCNQKRAVIFIDDLDRCVPEKAIEVLEAIKLFLDVKGCIFILGIDRRVISQGVKVKYKDFNTADGGIPINGDEYLEKIIQLSFVLPPILDENLKDFIIQNDKKEVYKNYHEMIIKGIGKNPRKIKRFLNAIEFQRNLAEIIPQMQKVVKEELKQSFDALLIEWQILSSTSNEELIKFKIAVSENSNLLIKMHNYIESPPETAPKELEPFLNYSVKELITAFPYPGKLKEGSSEIIDLVIHLSSVTETKVETEEDAGKPMTREELNEAIHNKRNLRAVNLRGVDLRKRDMRHMNFNLADLSGADLSNAKLYKAYCYETNFSNAILSDADFSEAILESANFFNADLKNTIFHNADLSNARNLLTAKNLSLENLSKNLSGVDLSGANLKGLNLFEANLIRTNLSGADLSGATLTNAKLNNAILVNSITEGVIVSPDTVTNGVRLVNQEDSENKVKMREALNKVGKDLREKIIEDNDLKYLLDDSN